MEVLAEVLPVERRGPGRQRRKGRVSGRQGQASHLWQGLELISTQPSTCSPRKLLIFIGCFWTACMKLPTFLPNDHRLSPQTQPRPSQGCDQFPWRACWAEN